MKLDEIEITEVQRLTFRPGDIMVIRTPEVLSAEKADMISGRAQAWIGDGIKVMVLSEGMSLEVAALP